MNLEETLNVISQLLRTRTNIFSICIQEQIGFGKFKTVLEGKYIIDIKENKDFNNELLRNKLNNFKTYRKVERFINLKI